VDGIAALPGNRELVDRIRAIADGAPPVAIAECRDTTSFGVGDQTVLDGSYRFELTADEVKKAGISDQHEIDQDIGLWTWKIADGHWTMTQTAGPDAGTETGPLWINKNVVIFKWPTNPPESYSWKADKDGSLTLTPIDVPAGKNAEVQMTLKRWERIG
jgi:hypothetical protein